MNGTLQLLVKSIQELRSAADMVIGADDAPVELFQHDLGADTLDAYRELTGHSCPKSLLSGLALPDTVSFNWTRGPVKGEFDISNLLLTISRTLDESLQSLPVGFDLASMRIIDVVVLYGGPFYVLLPVENAALGEQLYFFDTREVLKLALSYDDYLSQLGTSKGITYWQYLYLERKPLAGQAKKILREGIEFLTHEFPDWNYDDLRTRFANLSS